MIALPQPRGPASEILLAALTGPVAAVPLAPTADASEEDAQLALYLCYELHYRGLPGVDERWEWAPSLLALRGEAGGRSRGPSVARYRSLTAGDVDMDLALRAVEEADEAPSLSPISSARERWISSASSPPTAPPTSSRRPIPTRGRSRASAARRRRRWSRSRPTSTAAATPSACTPVLFARALDALGLDPRYGAYVDDLPAVTLATVNLMSLFGLHRRLRGAIVGHLALFEMTSSMPNRRYANGLRRLGLGGDAPSSTTSTWWRTRCTRTSPPSTWPAASPARRPSWPPTSCGARRPDRAGGPVRYPPARSWAAGRSSLRRPCCEPRDPARAGSAPGSAPACASRRRTADARLAAAAECDRIAAGVDLATVLIDEPTGPRTSSGPSR